MAQKCAGHACSIASNYALICVVRVSDYDLILLPAPFSNPPDVDLADTDFLLVA